MRRFQPERVDGIDAHAKRGEGLRARDHAELRRLLDQIGHVGAGVAEPDDAGLRFPRPREIGAEIRGVERMAGTAKHLATFLADDFCRVVFKVVAVAGIDGNEEPALLAAVGQRRANRVRDRISVEHVMDPGRYAGFVGQALCARAAQRDNLMPHIRDSLNDQRLGGAADVHDRVDVLRVEPVAGDRPGPVAAVVVVGNNNFDRRAQ